LSIIDGPEETPFDGLLAEDEMEKAHRWAVQAVSKAPWNWDYRGYLAFSLLLTGKETEAVEVAQEVVAVSPYNEWALSVLFTVSSNAEIENDSRFFGSDGFRLGATWYLRFSCLRMDEDARRLWGFIARYGPEEQKWRILEDVYEVER
jgi:hypothetical protein